MTLDEARAAVAAKQNWLWLVGGSPEKVYVGVKLRDARGSYGKTQVQIEPSSGAGRRWVLADSVMPLADMPRS